MENKTRELKINVHAEPIDETLNNKEENNGE